MNTGNLESPQWAPISLTRARYDLSRPLLREPNRVQTRNQILPASLGRPKPISVMTTCSKSYIRYPAQEGRAIRLPQPDSDSVVSASCSMEGDPWN